ARHDDAERLAGDDQPDEHADRRHDHGRQDEEGVIEAVKLRHKNDRHQENCDKEGLAEKILRFFLLLVLTLENVAHVAPEIGVLSEPVLDLSNLVIDQNARHDIRLYRHDTLRVGAIDASDLLLCGAGYEV